MKRLAAFLALAAVACGGAWLANSIAAEPAKPAVDLDQNLKKASVDGKYRMLLAQIKVEGDKETNGEFKDIGQTMRPQYRGYNNLPKGHWVYVYPYWYIWRDVASMQRPKRPWGPEQLTGEPDTNTAGDIQTAWASQSQDDQDEWLMLEYAEAVVPKAVLVYETYNPGALVRVTAFRADGQEVELWKGKDPTATDAEMGISEIPVKADFKTTRIKIYLASKDVSGWNEIDAVGVRDADKKMHWAAAADASSTYAQPYELLERVRVPENPYEIRIRKLEKEVADLKALVEEMKKKMDKKDK
jgi:hypothetical protein